MIDHTATPVPPATVQDAWRALDAIVDPCHELSGHPLSILDLGLVNAVEAVDGALVVSVTFTEPTCLYGYRIVNAIEDRLGALPGVRSVRVALEPFPLWDEERLSDRAREYYDAMRDAARPRLPREFPLSFRRLSTERVPS